MAEQRFAVFDIDGTFIRWQLFHAIVHDLGKNGYLPASSHEKIRAARFAWKNRLQPEGFADYEKVLVEAYLSALTHINPSDYRLIVDEVFEEYKDQTFTYTRDLARTLKNKGYLLFAVSGSQQEIVDRLVQYYGFDAGIGAVLEVQDGVFTGNVTTPVFDKRAALERLVDQFHADQKGSYAVGDSPSDISMLKMVENPIAFNPDQKLYNEAKKQGWKIVVERKNVVYEL
jgi:HAD superfamily hydrolase (TIGR01490 family)